MLRGTGQDFEITELELDPPKAGEVLIRFVASGLCHSDEHLRHGDIVPRFPIVGGHEGAGIIEEVGPGVTRLQFRLLRPTAEPFARQTICIRCKGTSGSGVPVIVHCIRLG